MRLHFVRQKRSLIQKLSRQIFSFEKTIRKSHESSKKSSKHKKKQEKEEKEKKKKKKKKKKIKEKEKFYDVVKTYVNHSTFVDVVFFKLAVLSTSVFNSYDAFYLNFDFNYDFELNINDLSFITTLFTIIFVFDFIKI